jgi:hypothetical protein
VSWKLVLGNGQMRCGCLDILGSDAKYSSFHCSSVLCGPAVHFEMSNGGGSDK